MAAKPTRFEQVLDLLHKNGPLTTTQMAVLAGVNQRTMSGGVRTARKFKRIHIHGWKRSYVTRGRWAAIYWLGDKDEAPPPQSDRVADSKRYWQTTGRLKAGAVPKPKKINPWVGLL